MWGIPTRGVIVLGVLATAGAMYVANGGERLGTRPAPEGCRVVVITDTLDVRSGPARTQPIVSTLRRGTVVPAGAAVHNGFRRLAEGKWVADEFVTPTEDSACG
ncbi:SH3 domain-containing protein [Saccharothrix coeruleofusca]|uniref:SH3 domain-containing protein n=1 Tax=Saccharothrix coeruleofusca TaxID=33919 RepID=A0A918AMI2_9PSEU|nr:SH3 domain-containing protein [Saccharothrix coeruleofusca]MBP2339245.1 uncharacterized protein YgiM (DUF1202 family) [Saccharothrix coeruleofusca]GGP59131.1 hypothetical protein GCM10010185_34530 [Saccharothrix coeruleofusca]